MRGAAVALVATAAQAGTGSGVGAGGDSVIGYALENLVSGTPATVRVGEASYAVTPLGTWRSRSGHWCRRYEMTLSQPGRPPQRSEATRCRQDGFWLEPAAE